MQGWQILPSPRGGRWRAAPDAGCRGHRRRIFCTGYRKSAFRLPNSVSLRGPNGAVAISSPIMEPLIKSTAAAGDLFRGSLVYCLQFCLTSKIQNTQCSSVVILRYFSWRLPRRLCRLAMTQKEKNPARRFPCSLYRNGAAGS